MIKLWTDDSPSIAAMVVATVAAALATYGAAIAAIVARRIAASRAARAYGAGGDGDGDGDGDPLPAAPAGGGLGGGRRSSPMNRRPYGRSLPVDEVSVELAEPDPRTGPIQSACNI